MPRPRSIRRLAGLALVLAGLGTAATAAPIVPASTPAVAEEAVAAAETAMVPQHLLAPAEPAEQDAPLPATARADAGGAAMEEGLSVFLRSVVAGPEAARLLAMVSAPFRGTVAHSARLVPCAVEDVCGLAVLPDLTDLGQWAKRTNRPELLARTDAVLPADALDLSAYHGAHPWSGAALAAPARDRGGRAEPPEPLTLRRLVLETLAIFGLDETARTLWSMPLLLVALVLSPVLAGMLTLGWRVPRRRHP